MDMNVNAIIKQARDDETARWLHVTGLAVLDALIKESEIETGRSGRLLFLGSAWQRCYRVSLVTGGYELLLLGSQGPLAQACFLTATEMLRELERCDVRARPLGR